MKNGKPKAIKYLALCAAILIFAALLCGCSMFGDNGVRSPQEVIKDAYGNQQFKISFSSTTLSEPINSLAYTALSIPEIPTPKRVGYIFQGWYYDAEYTEPFQKDSLYLKMQDVILYAKWVSEEFTANGIYDIHYDADLLEETVVKGSKTDTYGGYADFSEFLVDSEIYFEKSDDALYLRIQYDNAYMSASDVFSVTVSQKSGSAFKMATAQNIAVATETTRTIYIDWGENSIDTPLYLDIGWTNYANEAIPAEDVANTYTRYTVQFSITEFMGFTQSYVDLRQGMDDGWYSIRTYYRSEENGETTMSIYQSTYAYLYLKNGNYTLITSFKPYSLIIGNGDKEEYYYHRLMTFAPFRLFYDLNADLPGDTVQSDWYPSVYDAGNYHRMAMEYHADEKVYYHILDLGSQLKENYMVVNTVTGMMEMMTMGSCGRNNVIMSLDFDHILRLDESDVLYRPLTGDSFEWSDEMVYYPGSGSDFFYTETKYNDMLEYGLQDLNVNFFFSAPDLYSSVEERTMYSHRIEITPTAATAGMDISDNRYQLAYFDLHAQIYGYDGRGNLYADSYTTGRLNNNGLRETVLIVNGKSCEAGEQMDLADIYAGYFGAQRDFSKVTYRAYRMNNFQIDFAQEIALSSVFTFSEPIAVEFFYQDEYGTHSTIFEFAQKTVPTVHVDINGGQLYDPDENVFESGTQIYAPYITYSWMNGGKAADYIGGNSYGVVYIDGQYDINIVKRHAMRTTQFVLIDGKYLTGYSIQVGDGGSFYMPDHDCVIFYELFNRYGEKYFYQALYVASGDNSYVLYEDGVEISSGRLTNSTTGSVTAISYRDEAPPSLYAENFATIFQKNYLLVAAGQEYPFYLSGVGVRNTQRYTSFSLSDYDSVQALIAAASAMISDSEYAVISATYSSDRNASDAIRISGFYNVYFGGKKDFAPLPYQTVFTGTTYTLPYLEWQSATGVGLGEDPRFSLHVMRDGTATSVGNAASIRTENGVTTVYFSLPGTYRIGMSMTVLYDANGELAFDRQRTQTSISTNGTSYTVYYYFEVTDKNSTVTVTFHTLADHPFREEYGGGTLYTIECALQDGKVILPMQEYLEAGNAILMGWVRSAEHNARYPNMMAPGFTVTDFIHTFHSNEIHLYAAWDESITVTVISSVPIAGFPEEGLTVTLYMSKVLDWTKGEYPGFYTVNFENMFGSKIRMLISGSTLKFKGYTGGFLGDKIYTSTTQAITEGHDADYYVITAVFERMYKVKFDLRAVTEDGKRFTSEYYPYGEVYTGDLIVLPENRNGTPSCLIEGYEFQYWAVDMDHDGVISEEENVAFDLNSDVVTDEMADDSGFVTLIAVFGKIGE